MTRPYAANDTASISDRMQELADERSARMQGCVCLYTDKGMVTEADCPVHGVPATSHAWLFYCCPTWRVLPPSEIARAIAHYSALLEEAERLK